MKIVECRIRSPFDRVIHDPVDLLWTSLSESGSREARMDARETSPGSWMSQAI